MNRIAFAGVCGEMNRRAVFVATALFFVGLLLVMPLPELRAQYEEIVARARPAVVFIMVETDRGRFSGSGFFIDPSGYIVTNRHVIEDASRISVQIPDGRVLPAIIVRFSALFDVAVLKVDGSGFPVLTFGDSDSVQQGQEVIVIGYPRASALGSETATVTRGIISALRPAQGYIQLDAAMNPGNSGGPVLNRRGEVVGIAVSSLREAALVNFAVASNLARTLLTQLTAVAIPAPRSSPSAQPPGPQPTPPPAPQPSPPSARPAGTMSPTLIRPGASIGMIALDMTIDQAVQSAGRWTRSGAATPSGVFWSWDVSGPTARLSPRVSAFARDERSPINEIQTTSPYFATPGGIRVGDLLDKLKEELGRNYRVSMNLLYDFPNLSWAGVYAGYDPAVNMSDRRVMYFGVR